MCARHPAMDSAPPMRRPGVRSQWTGSGGTRYSGRPVQVRSREMWDATKPTAVPAIGPTLWLGSRRMNGLRA